MSIAAWWSGWLAELLSAVLVLGRVQPRMRPGSPWPTVACIGWLAGVVAARVVGGPLDVAFVAVSVAACVVVGAAALVGRARRRSPRPRADVAPDLLPAASVASVGPRRAQGRASGAPVAPRRALVPEAEPLLALVDGAGGAADVSAGVVGDAALAGAGADAGPVAGAPVDEPVVAGAAVPGGVDDGASGSAATPVEGPVVERAAAVDGESESESGSGSEAEVGPEVEVGGDDEAALEALGQVEVDGEASLQRSTDDRVDAWRAELDGDRRLIRQRGSDVAGW